MDAPADSRRFGKMPPQKRDNAEPDDPHDSDRRLAGRSENDGAVRLQRHKNVSDHGEIRAIKPSLSPSANTALVLLFDWWIINGDRQDANPNLLWLQHGKMLHVIDHNLAFGSDSPDEFWQRHIFRRDRPAMSALRPQMLPVMLGIIDVLPNLWRELPEEWTEQCIIRLDRVDEVLRRCFDDQFWAEA